MEKLRAGGCSAVEREVGAKFRMRCVVALKSCQALSEIGPPKIAGTSTTMHPSDSVQTECARGWTEFTVVLAYTEIEFPLNQMLC